MATMVKSSITEKVARGLRKAADEIEEFGVQANLGKLEARDIFEKVKKKYRAVLHDSVVRFEKAKAVTKVGYQKLRTAIDELSVQLALGKAESRDLYESQSKKIRNAIAKVQSLMKKSNVPEKYAEKMNKDLQKLKIKLDILKLKYKRRQENARGEERRTASRREEGAGLLKREAREPASRRENSGRKRLMNNRAKVKRDRFEGRTGGSRRKILRNRETEEI